MIFSYMPRKGDFMAILSVGAYKRMDHVCDFQYKRLISVCITHDKVLYVRYKMHMFFQATKLI